MKLLRIGVLAAALALAATAHAQVKISDLPAGTALAGTEAVPAVQSATTVKTTPAAINTYVQSQTTAGTITGKFTGTCDSTTFLRGDGSCATPTGSATSGTFTTTFTGFTVPQTNIGFSWWKNGNMVMLQMTGAPNGTSNANTVVSSAGALPAAIRPATTVQPSVTVGAQDGGSVKAACVQLLTDGTIQFGIPNAGNCSPSGWTASGAKIVYNGTSSGVGTGIWMYPVP